MIHYVSTHDSSKCLLFSAAIQSVTFVIHNQSINYAGFVLFRFSSTTTETHSVLLFMTEKQLYSVVV